jgi:hypothetical protein
MRRFSVIAGICLTLAPALQALSTVFWRDGHQGITTGALLVPATACWIVGLVAVFRWIEPTVPRYAAIGMPAAVYGCLGGVTFGVQGMQEELFGVPHAEAVARVDTRPLAAFLAFWIAGPLFPVSTAVLGFVLARIHAVPFAIGALICLGGVAFPLSRIPREPVIAHIADVILLVPFAYLGLRMASGTARRVAPADGPAVGQRRTWSRLQVLAAQWRRQPRQHHD